MINAQPEDIIRDIDPTINSKISKISDFISNKALINICFDYQEHSISKKDFGYNIFKIISDLYYRENFHSDIIASLLDKYEKHNEDDKYLCLFINLLNKKSKILLNKSDLINYEVYREKGRIDILIKDDTTKKAIIIENKINNAGDQPRQIPNYYKYLKVKGFETLAVVYLTLIGDKSNTFRDWTNEEILEIEPKIIKINASDETEIDLLNGWLKECELITNNFDAVCVIRQYSKLIRDLGGKSMNKQSMDMFYNLIKENEKFQTVLTIREMLQNMPFHLTQKFKEKFENNTFPFKSISIWSGKPCAFFNELFYENSNLAIDIWSFENKVNITFFDRNYNKNSINQAQLILHSIKMENEFYWNGSRFEINFDFPSRIDDCFIFLEKFVNELKKIKSS